MRGTIEMDTINPDTHQEQRQMGNFSNKLLDVDSATRAVDGGWSGQGADRSAFGGIAGRAVVINGGVDDSAAPVSLTR